MSSAIPNDGMPPCFHMMHAGKPLSSHGYPRPFDKDFHKKMFNIHTKKLGLYSYKAAQISTSLMRYTEQLRNLDSTVPEMQRQIRGLQQWKSLGSGKYMHLSMEKLLHLYSECLDDLFFGGILKGFYKIRFVDPSVIPGLHGVCSWLCSFEHGFEIDIAISNRGAKSLEVLNQRSRLRQYLGTLTHEMVHAVFQLYCCRTCTSCKTNVNHDVGPSGHSIMWQKLAMSIEDTLNQYPAFAGDGTFDFSRSNSFYLEYFGNRRFRPNISLQQSLTIRQLEGLKLDTWITQETRVHIQTRDRQRAAIRRKDAADRKKGLKPKAVVLSGRIAKPTSASSPH